MYFFLGETFLFSSIQTQVSALQDVEQFERWQGKKCVFQSDKFEDLLLATLHDFQNLGNDGFNHNRSGFGRLPNGFETDKSHETGSEDHQFDTRNQCNLPCNFVQEGSQHGETTTSLALRFHFSRSSRDGERSKARDSNDFFRDKRLRWS